MKILITGGSGLVGSAIKSTKTGHDLIFVNSSNYNLVDNQATDRMIKSISPDAIIHLAAKVGGVKSNIENQAEFFYKNIMMNTNVLHSAHEQGVKKVVSMLSTCIFPDKVSYPLAEDKLHDGKPHKSNFAYSYAKRMLDIQSRAYRDQYGSNFTTVVPNNIYGENDNFDLEDSHVVPAMIRKIFYSKKEKLETVKMWGDGSPLREFTYSKDIAKQLLFLVENYNDPDPINIGSDQEISIKNLSEIIVKEVGYQGEVVWHTDMPNGQHRKPSSKQKIKKLGYSEPLTDIQSGIKKTCEWYNKNYPNVRGVN